MLRYNDYELIYLIQTESLDQAMEIMIKKYHNFIWKNIHSFKISEDDKIDFYQEACILLVHCVKYFNEVYGKTFMRYFELVLKRKFYELNNKLPKYIIDASYIDSKPIYYLEEEVEIPSMLTEIEKYVFEHYFLNGVKIKYLVTEEYTKKKIYNAIFRIKEKYKNMI